MASSNAARLDRKARRLNRENDRLEEVLKRSWLLGDDEVEGIKPGDEGRLLSLLTGPFENPLVRTDQSDIENPHVHLLRLIRDPEFFAFTCEKVFNVTILPLQHCILKELWYKPFPMLVGSRGMGKSFILALYMMLKALINQGTKIVIVGAAFRQAKVVFEYVEMIWANAPVLRDLCGGGRGRNNREQGPRRDIDRCECIIGDSIIIALPLGDGKKIRGQRANIIVADEFASIPPDIYETVVKGFAAVSQDPVGNVKEQARVRVLKKLGRWDDSLAEAAGRGVGNQAILSGTAYYAFNWFAKYWQRYKGIIESRGDPQKLAELSQNGEYDPNLNWRDYCVIRVPVGLLPDGFMDKRQVSSSRAMVEAGVFLMEFGAVFATDSEGFFRRSLIERCVAGSPNSDIEFRFAAALGGEPGVEHVIGVDPASERDNFAIVVLALHPDHRRVVYCWTIRKKEYMRRKQAGVTKEKEFYPFVARKIRDLMGEFRTSRIMMDAQGGGYAVEEALQDEDKLRPGELPVWQVIDPDPKNRKDSDNYKGLHILEMVQFARADWVSDANHGMKKDMEDRVLLFPHLDAALLGLAVVEDKKLRRVVDTLDDAAMEVEELKDELANVVHSQTETGREKWDTPKVKGEASGKGRLRKDRYSALLMANMGARRMARTPGPREVHAAGGWARDLAAGVTDDGPMYVLGEGWGEMQEGEFGRAVRRGGR